MNLKLNHFFLLFYFCHVFVGLRILAIEFNFFIVIFVLPFVSHACMGWTVSYESSKHLSLAMSLLTFLSFRLLLNTSFHVALGHPAGKLPLSLKVPCSLDQALSSLFYRSPNHCSVLSNKHSVMLFNFSLVISSSLGILSSLLTLHIQLTTLGMIIMRVLFGQQ